MDSTWIILLSGAILGFGTVFFLRYANTRVRNQIENSVKNRKDFKVTEQIYTASSDLIAYDETNKKICLVINGKGFIIENKYLLKSEVEIDGKIELKSSLGSAMGRAIVGEKMIGGNLGAAVGAATAKKVIEEKIKSISLKITVSDNNHPIYRVKFLDLETTKGSKQYDESHQVAEKWNHIISGLIPESEGKKQGSKSKSTADELLKLKELLEANLLSKEEFEIEKQKLLKA